MDIGEPVRGQRLPGAIRIGVLVAAALAMPLAAQASVGETNAPCELSAADARYFQAMLDDWAAITGEIFRLPARHLPWVVMFDRSCAYHIAADTTTRLGRTTRILTRARLTFGGRPVPIRALPIGRTVVLPNGAEIPVSGLAFTAPYGEGQEERAFFVTALPDVWANDPKYAEDSGDWAEFVRSVLSHELVHTLQIVAIRSRFESLHARFPALSMKLDDDLIQRRFGARAEIDATVRAEIALLFAAAGEPDADRARDLARHALELLQARRTTYFADSAAAYSEMEDGFLNMEGMACWAALKLALRRQPSAHPAEVQSELRGNRKWWSQEEGLALFLLLDRWVPGWVNRVLPPELASPAALLAGAVSPRPTTVPPNLIK